MAADKTKRTHPLISVEIATNRRYVPLCPVSGWLEFKILLGYLFYLTELLKATKQKFAFLVGFSEFIQPLAASI